MLPVSAVCSSLGLCLSLRSWGSVCECASVWATAGNSASGIDCATVILSWAGSQKGFRLLWVHFVSLYACGIFKAEQTPKISKSQHLWSSQAGFTFFGFKGHIVTPVQKLRSSPSSCPFKQQPPFPGTASTFVARAARVCSGINLGINNSPPGGCARLWCSYLGVLPVRGYSGATLLREWESPWFPARAGLWSVNLICSPAKITLNQLFPLTGIIFPSAYRKQLVSILTYADWQTQNLSLRSSLCDVDGRRVPFSAADLVFPFSMQNQCFVFRSGHYLIDSSLLIPVSFALFDFPDDT